MDKSTALTSMFALSQETRLDAFRLLVKAGGDGLHAGEIANRLDVRQNTLSTNLAVLERSGLIAASREGRNIRYRVHMDGMRSLLAYLMEDCCGGNPSHCQAVLDELACDC
ncbi:MAG: metalloregulator ArsR/SmtB family transcription factor [Stappiaceae bacterium]